MEIIKHGNSGVVEDWRADVTCEQFDQYDREGCGAVLSINAEDLVLRYFKGTHFRHDYTAIQCPECDKHTRVRGVPRSVLKLVRTEEAIAAATFDGFQD